MFSEMVTRINKLLTGLNNFKIAYLMNCSSKWLVLNGKFVFKTRIFRNTHTYTCNISFHQRCVFYASIIPKSSNDRDDLQLCGYISYSRYSKVSNPTWMLFMFSLIPNRYFFIVSKLLFVKIKHVYIVITMHGIDLQSMYTGKWFWGGR